MNNKDILTEDEEKALVGLLYNHISFATTMEMFGELEEGGLKRIETLRQILSKLLRKYNLADSLPKETFLLLGLTEFLKKEELEEWTKLDNNKHIQNRAKFFLGKLQ